MTLCWYSGKDGGFSVGVRIVKNIVLASYWVLCLLFNFSLVVRTSRKRKYLSKLFYDYINVVFRWLVESQNDLKILKNRGLILLYGVSFESHSIKWFFSSFVILSN
jgi:hypothetical protein